MLIRHLCVYHGRNAMGDEDLRQCCTGAEGNGVGREDVGSAQRRRYGMSLVRCRAGTSVVEFAVATPVLLGLLVPLADLGIAYSRQIRLSQAAQAGAQYAIAHPWNSNSPADISNAVAAA